MHLNWRKYTLTRKLAKYVTAFPRCFSNITSAKSEYKNRPLIIANSFPKSGTHLLIQIAQAFPGTRDWGSFIASLRSSFFYRPLSIVALNRKIKLLAPAELCGAHIFYTVKTERIMKEMNVVHFFIYRDLRDVVISEAYYLTYMNWWHRLSRHFRALTTDEERITFAIRGAQNEPLKSVFPDIAQRFHWYRSWLHDPNTFCVKYENLISDRRESAIYEMIQHYAKYTNSSFDHDLCFHTTLNNINPAKSHTYRQGKAGGWREVFTEQHKSIFKQLAGNLLIELGYEQDNSW